eukprot:2977929-Rhodomonas_salina.4
MRRLIAYLCEDARARSSAPDSTSVPGTRRLIAMFARSVPEADSATRLVSTMHYKGLQRRARGQHRASHSTRVG